MGSRSAETVKLLEARAAVLARLQGTLDELQRRTPSVPGLSGALSKIAPVGSSKGASKGSSMFPPKIASGGGGAVAMWAVRKLLKRKRAKKKAAKRSSRKAAPQTAVSVKVFPSGTGVAIVAAAAIWAGVKIFEMQGRGSRTAGVVSALRKGA